MHPAEYWRRDQSAVYLKSTYGHGSKRTLAKLATTGGGPEMFYSGRIPLYTQESLDKWALGKLSGPVCSTSERAPQSDTLTKRGRPAGAKPVSVAPDRAEAAEAEREAV
jgi:hypothetical protein